MEHQSPQHYTIRGLHSQAHRGAEGQGKLAAGFTTSTFMLREALSLPLVWWGGWWSQALLDQDLFPQGQGSSKCFSRFVGNQLLFWEASLLETSLGQVTFYYSKIIGYCSSHSYWIQKVTLLLPCYLFVSTLIPLQYNYLCQSHILKIHKCSYYILKILP